MEQVNFNGWPNTIRLHNDQIEVLVTTDVGPRIARCGYIGESNLFAEIEGQQGGSGEQEWMLRGGHRLWIAPEKKPETYELDNTAVSYEAIPGGVRVSQPKGPMLGIAKRMEVVLSAESNRVEVTHSLTNESGAAVDLAAWAPTVMAPDGMAVIPLPQKIPHTERLIHNQEWSLWGYTDFSDPRWTLGSRYVFFRQDRTRGPNKLGLAHREGWVAYLLGEFCFVKRFAWQADGTYPDGGVNFETFSNEEFLELESLGPMVRLEAGQQVTHQESWEIYRGVEHVSSEADADRWVKPLASPS